VVVAPPSLAPAHWTTLHETQPQARVALFGGGGPLFVGPRLLAHRVDVALVERTGVTSAASGLPVVTVGSPIDDQRLEEALSYVGIAPPAARPDALVSMTT
jgi:hypothetical protein